MASRVEFAPVPAMIGMRSGSVLHRRVDQQACSSKSTVGDSPVVPTTTMPSVPSSMCQSMRLAEGVEVERAVLAHRRDDGNQTALELGHTSS